jgi:hypothetical protein
MFNQMNTRKIFYNHAATLLPDSTYYIETDGCHLHTYTRPRMPAKSVVGILGPRLEMDAFLERTPNLQHLPYLRLAAHSNFAGVLDSLRVAYRIRKNRKHI